MQQELLPSKWQSLYVSHYSIVIVNLLSAVVCGFCDK